MIQRLQSLWLLIAGMLALLSFKFPFYSGNILDKDNLEQPAKFTASFDFLTLFLTALLGIGCIIIIFLYKNRKLQLRLTIVALIVAILNLIVYFNKISKFEKGELSFAAILSFAIPFFLFFAVRGIWKDEKLVKSLDRLR